MDDSNIFIVGANGQLGTALKQKYTSAKSADINELDITNKKSVEDYDWSDIKVIINAAGYTNVDGAETTEGRRTAWLVNASALSHLTRAAHRNNIIIVHISTDYVFDGTKSPHTESEALSPLSVYGASKAAGDLIVACHDEHYIIRTSGVIGEGKNFVRIMLEQGKSGANPSVVSDQIGRLTFTDELVRGIDHLLTKKCEFGTYNLSNGGEAVSWADITREIFKQANLNNSVLDVSTEDYLRGKTNIAPRPLQSTLDLAKIQSTGFVSNDWRSDLAIYVRKELAK